MHVALATCSGLPDLDADSALLPPALHALGVATTVAVWDDPAVDWAAYDLVVVRSTWDYVPRRAEFLGWAATVPRLANPAHVLTWNTDKTYLRELAAAGIPVVPTTYLAPGQAYERPGVEHVVKPTVSVGAQDTERFGPDGDGSALVARLHAQGRTAMVQPYLEGVEADGETAVVMVAGELSHAARKAPLLAPGAAPYTYDDTEVMSPREPTVAQVDLARAVLAAAPGPLLYARVDVVPGPDGSPVLLELEATEPSLFLRQTPTLRPGPDAAAALAMAVRALLE